MMEFDEADYLMISGLQHFSFCKRQWALIHIENQWQENLRTVEGNIVHERCHDKEFTEKRGELLITRGMRVFSRTLGVTGECDVVEFRRGVKGTKLFGQEGLWQPLPIEYKRGKSKINDADRLQVCCQAMCLEEMLACDISEGAIYYNETRRRETVVLDTKLRTEVSVFLGEMHEYYRKGYTPKTKVTNGCKLCSLQNICLPKLCKQLSVKAYYKSFLEGADE